MSSSDVNLSSGMRSNLLLLQKTNKQVENIQQKLATGNKVNSALDGPNQFFAAKNLSTRAGDLSSLKEAMGQSISTIQAGDKGISAIQDLVEQAKGITASAYSSLGTDAASIATRKGLAEQFNRIKDQIDKIVGDSGYAGKNLLAGNGKNLDSTADSRKAVNSISGLSSSRVTNVVSADTYSVKVSGTGNVSGNLDDIAAAERDRGLASLKVSGKLSATAGNFSDITIEMRGNEGRERTVVVSEGGESRTFKFFDNTQSATATLQTAGATSTAQVSQVKISGTIEEGDTFTATVNGQSFTYKAAAEDLFDAGTGADLDASTRQANVASKLRDLVNTGLDTAKFTVGAAASGAFTISAASGLSGTANSFTVSATTGNSEQKSISVTFSSGTTVSFDVNAKDLSALGGSANKVSTIEKNVDIEISATNLNGVTVSRSGTNDRGNAKLSDGENSFTFASGTVRVEVDAKEILNAATAQKTANLTTTQRTDASTENDLNVQFNSDNTSSINVLSQNVTTNGQGLRIDYAQNGFMDRADIDKAVASLDYATQGLRSASQSLSTNLNVIQTRESFTDEFSNVLVEGSNKLIQADQNEEGANLLLLQTRQQLGTISLSLANQAQQSILRLF
ncbi:flagellin [Niveispirillum irakense]|uniref:flagellin N-terminal helical domain-containing protein n=1 Tax=Niveispirillum irakense TaxID=34011 RepID=UPI00041252DD|nr:flagellin [Niveispirillum irakense]